jgi:hypothetical protein
VLGSLMAKGFGAHAVFSKVCIVSCLNGAQGAKLPTYLTLRMALVVVLRGPVFRSGKGSRRSVVVIGVPILCGLEKKKNRLRKR